MEGAEYHLSQQYDKALSCYQNALKGFIELRKTDDEISVLRHIAEIKGTLYDVTGSEEAYKQALSLSRQTGKSDVQMEILKELWKIGKTIGDVQQAQAYAASIDSLVGATSDLQTKYTYYNQKAMRQETWDNTALRSNGTCVEKILQSVQIQNPYQPTNI